MIYIRPWNVKDASFICKLRNDPKYMQFYRQEKPISLKEEIEFIKKSASINYQAYILMEGKVRLGMFALHGSELCVVSPSKHYELGINLLKALNPNTMIHADVFTYNHEMLKTLLGCGFKVYGVKERYCKKQGEWVGVVKLMNI